MIEFTGPITDGVCASGESEMRRIRLRGWITFLHEVLFLVCGCVGVGSRHLGGRVRGVGACALA